MEDEIPGWQSFGMDDFSDFHTAPIAESVIPPMEGSSDSIESFRSYDGGKGLITAPIAESVTTPWSRSVSSKSYDSGVGLAERHAKTYTGPLLQQPANKSRFTCLLCPETVGRTYEALNSFKLHISVNHYPQFKMRCPYGDWIGRYAYNLRRHFRSAHSGQALPPRRETQVPNEAPVSCALCDKAVRNWDEFYNCLVEHCEMKEMGSMTQSLAEEQAVLPGVSRKPTNELIVKTDGDLACDELLNNYLDRSDFVSTFSLDIFRKAYPRPFDVKRADRLLSDLPYDLWYFAGKLSFKGSEPCKRLGLMVCNHSGYVFRTKACHIKY